MILNFDDPQWENETNNMHNVVHLYEGPAPGSEHWTHQEKEHLRSSDSRVVYNVTNPTLTVFTPEAATANSTALIICPGGAFHTLAIDHEGYDVAHWLAARGLTCFVLKYRLVESKTDDPVQELDAKFSDRKKLDEDNAPVVPLAIADGKAAVAYVRQHAPEFGINPQRIGIMGFSAGGTVAAGVAYGYAPETRPDFVAPIYAYRGALGHVAVPTDAPPLFITVATDDNFGFAPDSIRLYNDWLTAEKSAELHIFSRGGHGFGLRKQNLPVDQWIDLFYDRLGAQGLLRPV